MRHVDELDVVRREGRAEKPPADASESRDAVGREELEPAAAGVAVRQVRHRLTSKFSRRGAEPDATTETDDTGEAPGDPVVRDA